MKSLPSGLQIVLANGSLARYPQGGGHWMVRLQYLLGLKALGHSPFLLEVLTSHGSNKVDDGLVKRFFSRLRDYGLEEDAALLLFKKRTRRTLASAEVFGRTRADIRQIASDSDCLLNDCRALRGDLLEMFPRRVLLDLDPGHFQVSALQVEMDVARHHSHLTVGLKLNDADCEVPSLGIRWYTFVPFVFLPMWKQWPDVGPNAPFSSITHWDWGELWLEKRVLSISKRDAYLRYLDLPQAVSRPFLLAAQILPDDATGDRELLSSHGWQLVDPWSVAGSPTDYQEFIGESRAEINCPKPIFRELKTGWFSDRSVCYLASARPVLAEDTGFSDHLPTGEGLIPFGTKDEAVEGIREIDTNYEKHSKSAREIVEEYMSSEKVLPGMLEAFFWNNQ